MLLPAARTLSPTTLLGLKEGPHVQGVGTELYGPAPQGSAGPGVAGVGSVALRGREAGRSNGKKP